MTVAVVVYILIVTAPLIAAAALTEKLCRMWSLPVRGAWAVTALLIVLIGGRAVTQQMIAPQAVAISATTNSVRANSPIATSETSRIGLVVSEMISLPRSAATYVAHITGPTQSFVLAALWCLMSAIVLSLICFVYFRVWSARRTWRIADFAGQNVRVAPHAGPALVGVFHPEIVVPHWVLEARPEDSKLILMHEMEHRAARDPLLLAAMWALVALVPWHPGAWYCLARMRLAIELDCDARVVGRGASLRTYAQLLVHQARIRLGAPMHLWLGATSLLEPSSHLERRLRAMIIPDSPDAARRPLARYLRTASYVAIVSTIAIAACESHVPTAADISGLDAASAEMNARQAQLIDKNGQAPTFYVNGSIVSAEIAKAIPADSIQTVTVTRASKSVPGSTVRIAKLGYLDSGTVVLHTGMLPLMRTQDTTEHVAFLRTTPAKGEPVVAPLFLINGVPADAATYKALDPKNIASVDVLKGPAALKITANPLAKNGVVMITLKH